jgi:hypothetical protein
MDSIANISEMPLSSGFKSNPEDGGTHPQSAKTQEENAHQQ